MVARRYCTEHLARGQLSQGKHTCRAMRSATVSGPIVPKQRSDCGGLGYINRHERRLTASLLNQADGVLPALHRDIGHYDSGSCPGESAC